MGTEVLRPQNCLIDRFREPQPSTVFHRRKNGSGYYNNNYGYRKPVVRTEKKKLNNKIQNQNQNQSEPSISKPVQITGKVTAAADGGIVMGQVTILRRGESLDSLNSNIRKENNKATSLKKKKKQPGSGSGDELTTVYGTGRLGPEQPKMLPKNIRVGFTPTDMYAGSAFSNSPSPRSLPLPSFFNNINNNNISKKQVEFKPFDDSASRDLRRLLRLE